MLIQINGEEYLTVKEYAERNGVSKPAVYKHISKGRLDTLKIGNMRLIPKNAAYPVWTKIRTKPRQSNYHSEYAEDPAFIPIRDAAQITGISNRTIRIWIFLHQSIPYTIKAIRQYFDGKITHSCALLYCVRAEDVLNYYTNKYIYSMGMFGDRPLWEKEDMLQSELNCICDRYIKPHCGCYI